MRWVILASIFLIICLLNSSTARADLAQDQWRIFYNEWLGGLAADNQAKKDYNEKMLSECEQCECYLQKRIHPGYLELSVHTHNAKQIEFGGRKIFLTEPADFNLSRETQRTTKPPGYWEQITPVILSFSLGNLLYLGGNNAAQLKLTLKYGASDDEVSETDRCVLVSIENGKEGSLEYNFPAGTRNIDIRKFFWSILNAMPKVNDVVEAEVACRGRFLRLQPGGVGIVGMAPAFAALPIRIQFVAVP